jgi:hypothetical protein
LVVIVWPVVVVLSAVWGLGRVTSRLGFGGRILLLFIVLLFCSCRGRSIKVSEQSSRLVYVGANGEGGKVQTCAGLLLRWVGGTHHGRVDRVMSKFTSMQVKGELASLWGCRSWEVELPRM